MKMPGKCTGPKYLSKDLVQWEEEILGVPWLGKKSGQARVNMDVVQEMLRLCEAENGTTIAELLQARASGHQGTWQDVETNPDS